MAVVVGAALLLCVGGPLTAYLLLKDDVGEVVEATQTRVVAPETLNGRPQVSDPQMRSQVDASLAGMRKALPAATSSVGQAYGEKDAEGQYEELFLVLAVSNVALDPEKELNEALRGMQAGGMQTDGLTPVDPGPLGGHARCGDNKVGQVEMAICVWMDKGSFGMITYYFHPAADLQREFVTMRGAIEQRS
ncbi:hypothetical protein [Phytohabitans houttuyneae]|uniref:Uncharacterized protein n=1 Tax=Phytohabitans houttuyneae TaxID=1076126 RepID=A0A6V8JXB5_9ACTN|nr:hypothetical protein [Phytohabitans houttuyneae]GFJ77393.1 hypothetical protein Phou_015730 [Phytohabitans houttuyneae]